jgi:hypothetical protein
MPQLASSTRLTLDKEQEGKATAWIRVQVGLEL